MGQHPSKPSPEVARLRELLTLMMQADRFLDSLRAVASDEVYNAASNYWQQLADEQQAILARMGEGCSLHLVTAGLDMRTACLCRIAAWHGWAALTHGTTLAAAGRAASASAACWSPITCLPALLAPQCSLCSVPPWQQPTADARPHPSLAATATAIER